MKRYWIKLWLEILDDPKMGKMPDWLWRRAIELFLLAGENGNDGLLQPVVDLAWRLRTSDEKVIASLAALSEVGVVHETPEGWVVTNFGKRQEALTSTERVRRFRERNDNETETFHNETKMKRDETNDSVSVNSVSVSSSVSLSVEERKRLKLFVGALGPLLSSAEGVKWLILVDDYGEEIAGAVLEWARKREIRMTNRAALMDSLETAAKNWLANKGKPADVSLTNLKIVEEMAHGQ